MFFFNWGNLGRSNTLGDAPGLPGDDTAKDSATKAAPAQGENIRNPLTADLDQEDWRSSRYQS
jgi:hypothetical protein